MPDTITNQPVGIENIGLGDITNEGVANGASPWQIAGAVKAWREDAIAYGRETIAKTDPEAYWQGTARIDADVNDTLTALRLEEVNRRVNALGYTNPDDKQNFLERLDSADGNPNSTALSDLPAPSGATEKLVAADIQKLAKHPAFTLDTNLSHGNTIDVGGNTLARFSLRDSGKGKVDALVNFDRPDLQREIEDLAAARDQQPAGVGKDTIDSINKAIADKQAEIQKSVQVVTLKDVDMPTRIKEQEAKIAEAEKRVANAETMTKGAEKMAAQSEAGVGAVIGASEESKYAAQDLQNQQAILAGLKSPGGRTFALNLDLQEELKKPEYEAKMGDKNLWGDFVSGAQQAIISSGITVARIGELVGTDAVGDTTFLRQGLRDLQTSEPGSTQRAFQGGLLNQTTQGAANSLGSMALTVLPTGALSRAVTGGMEKMLAKELVANVGYSEAKAATLAKGQFGTLGEAASASAMGPMSYGSEYARMLDQADSLQKTDPELAAKIRSKADIAALMQASIDFGTELIGEGHNPFLERAGFATYLRHAPGNIVKEGTEEVLAGGLERGIKQPITQDGTPQANQPVTQGMVAEFSTGAAAAGPLIATGAPFTGSSPPGTSNVGRAPQGTPAPGGATARAAAASAASQPAGQGQTNTVPPPPGAPTPESFSKPPPETDELNKIDARLAELQKIHGPLDKPAANFTPENPQMEPYRIPTTEEKNLMARRDELAAQTNPAQAGKDSAILHDSAAHGLLLLGGVGPEATEEKITSNALVLNSASKESADSLAAQVDMMVDPSKPKTAVFIDEGTPAVQEPVMAAVEAAKVKHNVEGNFGLVKVDGGMVLFDTAVHPDEAMVVQMANSGTLGQALGYGVASKPDVVSEQNRALMAAEEAAGKTGTELQQRALAALTILLQSPGEVEKAAVVTDGTPEAVKAVKEALQKLASPTDKIVEVPAAQMPDVIAQRERHKADLEAALKRKQGRIESEKNQTTMPFDAAEPIQRGNVNAWERAKNGDEKAFDELDKQKRARLGEPPQGKAGQDAPQRFYTAADFERFFERAFAALNFQAFLEAIKATDRKIYTPLLKSLFAASKAGDAVAESKAEWFRHAFAGTAPANAKTPPPPASTPPRTATTPPAGGSTSSAPPPPPPPPPPKPPATPKSANFNIPALVHLSRILGSLPSINLRMRRFIRGSFSSRTGEVSLNKTIFQDPAQAAKTLAHEIGHFIDMIGQGLQSSHLTQKIAPLGDWKNIFGPLWAWAKLNPSARSGYNFGPIEKILKDEAIALSKGWRGDFDEKTNRYRASGNELYADFLSALMNDPTWTAKVAPNLSWFFTNALSQKPAVMAAWTHVQDLLKGDALMAEIENGMEESSVAATRAKIEGDFDSKFKKQEKELSLNRFFRWLHGEFVNAPGPMLNKASNADKQGIGKLLSKIGLGYTARWFDEMRRRVGAQFGSDYGTRTEEAIGYARSRKSWLSDKFTSLVYRPLIAAGIPAQMLGNFMMHNRIINDSTATAEAYKADPDLFRAFLKWLVEQAGLKDTTATTGRGASAFDFSEVGIDSIPQSELMDRAAAMFRFINEQTDSTLWDKINRAAQSRKAPAYAGGAMLMFNVSAYQANPRGFTPEESRKALERMEKNLGVDRFGILTDSANAFYDISSEIMHEANALGMFKPKQWREIIEPNLRSYAPWAVLDYYTGHISASASQKKNGTFKDILRPDLAYQLKLGALVHRMQRQKVANIIREFFTRAGKEFGFSGEMQIEDDLTDQKKAEYEKRGYGVTGFWDKGTYRHIILEDGKMLSFLEHYNPDDVSPLMQIAHENYGLWYKIVIAFSPSFQVGNFERQVRTSSIEVGYKKALRFLWDSLDGLSYPLRQKVMRLARNDPSYNLPTANLAIAYARAVTGDPWTPEIEELVKRGALQPPESKQMGTMTHDDYMDATTSGLVSMLSIGSPEQITLTDGFTYAVRHKIPVVSFFANAALNGLSWMSSIVESGAKIARFQALEEKNAKLRAAKFAAGGKIVANPPEEFSPQFVNAISRLSGIPNPGVSPRGTSLMDAVFMFARVHIQGLRRQRTLAFNPRTRGGFVMRAMLDVMPIKTLTAMAAIGTMDALLQALGGGDDEERKRKPWIDWQEWAKRASPYKIEKDDELFIGWISDKDDGPLADSAIGSVPFFGQIAKRWHPPYGHDDIPKEWTPLAMRLAHSEEGRLTAPTTFQLANTMLESPLAVDPEKRAAWATKFVSDSILPSLNPTLKYIGYAKQAITSDEVPIDTYRNRPIADPSQWAVGDDMLGFGSDDLFGMGTYLNRAELIGLDLAAEVGIPGFKETHKNENLPGALLAIQQTSGLSRLIAIDNYQGVREYKDVSGDNKRISQRADLMKGKETKKAVARMTYLQTIGDPKKTTLAGEKNGRDEGHEAEYRTLRQWYNKYYQGTDKDPGLYDVMKKYAQAKEEKNQEYIKKLEPEAKLAANMLEQKAAEANKFATEARHSEELPKRATPTNSSERANFNSAFPETKSVLPAPPKSKARKVKSSGTFF